MDKAELRQQMINKLKDLQAIDKVKIESHLKENLLASTQWKKAKIIGITISQSLEWSTRSIIEAGWEQGKTIVVPRCVPEERKLNFYKFTSYDELEVVYYQLKEPKADPENYVSKQSIDLIVVPGVVFDERGYRIGFGGGYYDRFLADYEGTTISIMSEQQLIDQVPTESFDIPVDHLLTERRIVK